MTSLIPIITNLGITKIFNATNDGLQGIISHIAVGDASYVPTAGQTALISEKARIPVSSGRVIDGKTLHISGLFESASSYWVREIGFFLSDGTLFAVYSRLNNAIAYKNADTNLLLAFDLTLMNVPSGSVTIPAAVQDINLSIAAELAQIATVQIQSMVREIAFHDRLLNLEY